MRTLAVLFGTLNVPWGVLWLEGIVRGLNPQHPGGTVSDQLVTAQAAVGVAGLAVLVASGVGALRYGLRDDRRWFPHFLIGWMVSLLVYFLWVVLKAPYGGN